MDTPPGSPRPPSQLLDMRSVRAIVTGAGRGLGKAIAQRLAAAGAQVIVNHRSGDGEAVAAAIRASGGQAIPLRADVSAPDGPSALIRGAVQHLGGIEVLINNAAIQPVESLESITAEAWAAVTESNLGATFGCLKEASGVMADGAAIVNIASIEAFQALPGHAHYAASKAGVVRLTQAAAMELGPRGIRVNAVAPGLIWRQGLEEDWPAGVARWEQAAPLHRLGHPDDVADAVLFLTSPAARWITGTTLTVDGGMTATPAW